MRKIFPMKFEGSTGGDVAEAWLTKMENYFEIKNYSEITKAIWGALQLAGEESNGG